MGRRGGSRRRKKRTHVVPTVEEGGDAVPRSFIFRRGTVPSAVRDLIQDTRTVLMPHTARNLKEHKKNSLKDYVAVSGRLGITHFWVFTHTTRGPYLRIMRTPQGPTLGFRVLEYTLCRDVRKMQRRPVTLVDADLKEPPLLVLSRFNKNSEDGYGKLVTETLRQSFPPLDVKNVHLSDVRRVVLVERNEGNGLIFIRHYVIRVKEQTTSKSIKKLVGMQSTPRQQFLNRFSSLRDAAELVEKNDGGAFSSDSEGEETLLENYTDDESASDHMDKDGGGIQKRSKNNVRLTEVGPRLTLEFVKAESGLADGEMLYKKYGRKEVKEIASNAG